MTKNKRVCEPSLEDFTVYFKNLITLVPCHIYWKDKDGKYLGCNHLQAQNLGLSSPNDIIGKTDFDLAWADQAEKLQTADRQVMISKQSQTFEEEVILANQKKAIFLSKKAVLLSENNEIKGIIGISFDITEQKLLESELRIAKGKAETASQAKTEFLENMRHDIRTPLTGIVGFSEILKMESNEQRIKDYADNLVASSHALLNLLDEVLETVRVSSGEIPKLKKKFNLEKTLNHIIELNRARAAQKKLILSLDLDQAIPKYVIGDKVRLHRIVLELIANALNFTDAGFVKLSVHLGKRSEGKLILKFIVEDSGIGIPKDKQQEVYVQFKRLTPSYQGIYQGAGLGLSVVKQFIDELNGEIYVESEVKRGTLFTCIIPLQEPLLDDASGIDDDSEKMIDEAHEKTFVRQIKRTVESEHQYTSRILVVEDNPIAQIVAKSILAKLGCQVETADTGKKAIDLCQHNHYDLIFMDIGLPDLNGYEVTRQIRLQETDKKTPSTIIALTAHAGDENKQSCIEVGMNAVLTKPLTQTHAVGMLQAFVTDKKHPLPVDMKFVRTDLPDTDEEMFLLDQFALLDEAQGLKTCGDKATLFELLTMMVNQIPDDLQRLKEAFAIQDYTLVENLAHKMKGSAVYVGATRMKYACQYVERYWKTGELEWFDKLCHQAVEVIEDTLSAVTEWLNKRNEP